MAFEDFQSTDEYGNLNVIQKMNAAGSYYDQKVAKDIPEEHREAGRQAFIEQKTPDAFKTAIGGAHSFLSNIGNVESEIGAKVSDKFMGTNAATQAYEQSPERQQTQQLNTQQAARIAQENNVSGTVNVPYMGKMGMGNVYDMVGQTLPIAGAAGPIAGAAESMWAGGTVGIPIIEKAAPFLAKTTATGAIAGAGQPANAPTVNQSIEQTESNVGQGILAAPVMEAGLKAPGFLTGMATKAKNIFSKTGAKQTIGEEFNTNLSPEAQSNLINYTNTPKGQQEVPLNTTAVTEDPWAFRKASEIRNKIMNKNGQETTPGLIQTQQNAQARNVLSNKLENANVQGANPSEVQTQAATTVEKEQARINSPLTFQESTLQKPEEVASAESTTSASGKLSKEVYDKIYQADETQKEAHAAIDPDNNILVNTQSVTNDIKSTVSNPTVRNVVYGLDSGNGALAGGDSILKPIFNRYYGEENVTSGARVTGTKDLGAESPINVVEGNAIGRTSISGESLPKNMVEPQTQEFVGTKPTEEIPATSNEISVRQMLDDKNTLENYIYDKKTARMEGSNEPNLNEKIEAAINLSNSIKDNLSKQSAPSAIEGKSVGQAFTEAQKGTNIFYSSLLENTGGFAAKKTVNPETGEITESHFSPSPTGKMYRAGKNQAAGPEAAEGRAIFDPTKPDTFVTSLRNIGNIKDIEPTVKQNILSHINEASDNPIDAFDKVYTPDIDKALRDNGFSKTADALTNLRDNLGAQNQTLESQNALLKLGKDRAQADLDATTAAKIYSKGNPLTQNQIADIVLKSPESKADALNLVNTNPSAQRGLGQILLNKIKSDSIIKGVRDTNNAPIQGVDALKLNRALAQHEDILKQTLGTDAFNAVKDINNVAMKVEYSESGTSKSVGTETNPQEALYKGTAVEVGSKILKAGPPSAILHPLQAIKELSKKNYYSVLADAQDPYVARQLMDAAKNKGESSVQTILNSLGDNSNAITRTVLPEQNKGNSSSFTPPTFNKGDNVASPQSNNSAIGATNAALEQSKKNEYQLADVVKLPLAIGIDKNDLLYKQYMDMFQRSKDKARQELTNPHYIPKQDNDEQSFLSQFSPIGNAEASEIHVPKNTAQTKNITSFKDTTQGQALQQSIRHYGANAAEIMAVVNGESSISQGNIKNYGQMTDAAWKQAQQIVGRTLSRSNPHDYADAVVSFYKWTAQNVKQAMGTDGTPSVKDVYIAYNAGLGGFKALKQANPKSIAANVVGESTAKNNPGFYFAANGHPLTVAQTIQAYHSFMNKKLNEVSPASATRTALSNAQVSPTNEPDGTPIAN